MYGSVIPPTMEEKMEREDWNTWHYQSLKDPGEAVERMVADFQVNLPVKNFLSGLLSPLKDYGWMLDLGSSPFSFTYIPDGQRVISVDWTRYALQGESNVLADVTRLPFPADLFPVVCSKQVYRYLDNPDLLLKEMARVLKPGGLFILIDGEYIGSLNGRNVEDDKLSQKLKLKPQEVAQKLSQLGIVELRAKRLFYYLTGFSKLALTVVYGRKTKRKL